METHLTSKIILECTWSLVCGVSTRLMSELPLTDVAKVVAQQTKQTAAAPGPTTTEEGPTTMSAHAAHKGATESAHVADEGAIATEGENMSTQANTPGREVKRVPRVRGANGRVGGVEVQMPTTLDEAVAI